MYGQRYIGADDLVWGSVGGKQQTMLSQLFRHDVSDSSQGLLFRPLSISFNKKTNFGIEGTKETKKKCGLVRGTFSLKGL